MVRMHLCKESQIILLQTIEDRIGKKSTLLASQVLISQCHEVIREQTIVDAIRVGLFTMQQRDTSLYLMSAGFIWKLITENIT